MLIKEQNVQVLLALIINYVKIFKIVIFVLLLIFVAGALKVKNVYQEIIKTQNVNKIA